MKRTWCMLSGSFVEIPSVYLAVEICKKMLTFMNLAAVYGIRTRTFLQNKFH